MMFEIKPFAPEAYRQQTRRSTLILAGLFLVLSLALSSAAVLLFGESGGDNFRFNLAGVIAALLITSALVRYKFCSQPWMAAAVYGWQLKRSLMSITNVMHHVNAGVLANDPAAMYVLRFYHLGLTQMHQLDGNASALNQTLRDSDQHKACMLALALDPEQKRLDPAWLTAVKQASASK